MEDRAGPTAHVRYEREAWISPFDNSVRVTMDRNVMIAPEFAMRFTAEMDQPTCVFGALVILELKFSGRFPDWFKELVRVFGLRQGSASKYADGIANQGERYFCRPGGGAAAVSWGLAGEDRRRERQERLAALLGQA